MSRESWGQLIFHLQRVYGAGRIAWVWWLTLLDSGTICLTACGHALLHRHAHCRTNLETERGADRSSHGGSDEEADDEGADLVAECSSDGGSHR